MSNDRQSPGEFLESAAMTSKGKTRDQLKDIATALAAPMTPMDVLMALNAPAEISPLKKDMENFILLEYDIEQFFKELDIIIAINKENEETRRENLLQALKDLIAYNDTESRHRFTMDGNSRHPESLSEIESRAIYLENILIRERKHMDRYLDKKSVFEKELNRLDDKWEKRQNIHFNEFRTDFETNMQNGKLGFKIEMTDSVINRLENAHKHAPISKIMDVVHETIKEAGSDPGKMKDYANTMAHKGKFICNLKVLSEIVRIKDDDAEPELNIKNRILKLKALDKLNMIKTDIEQDKKDYGKAILNHNALSEVNAKIENILVMEKTLIGLQQKISRMQNAPSNDNSLRGN